MQWQKIETAPKDGTVILTDQGTALFRKYWFSEGKWYLSDMNGNVHESEEWGPQISALDPSHWMLIPELPNNP